MDTPACHKYKINIENSLGIINACISHQINDTDFCELLLQFDKSRSNSRTSIKDYKSGELLGFLESISLMGSTPYAVVKTTLEEDSKIELFPRVAISHNNISIINIDGLHC